MPKYEKTETIECEIGNDEISATVCVDGGALVFLLSVPAHLSQLPARVVVGQALTAQESAQYKQLSAKLRDAAFDAIGYTKV